MFTKFSDLFKRQAKGIFTALARDPKLGSILLWCKLRDEQGNSKSILSGADVGPQQISLSLLFFGVGLTSAFPLSYCNEIFFFVCTERETCLTIYWLSTMSIKTKKIFENKFLMGDFFFLKILQYHFWSEILYLVSCGQALKPSSHW